MSLSVQKCDATRPSCSTCKVAGKEKECTYDENVEQTLTEALFLRTHILEQRLAAYEGQAGVLEDYSRSDGTKVQSQAVLNPVD